MNPLFLITKGIKARKKRLGGGSPPPVSPSLLGTKITAVNFKASVPNTHATIGLDIYDATNGNNYTDPITGARISGVPIDDFVATSLGTTHFGGLTGGIANLPASSSDWDITFRGTIHNTHGSTSNEILEIQEIHNTTGTASIIHQQTDLLRYYSSTSTHRIGRLGATIPSTTGAGEIIFKVFVQGGGSDTDSNVIAGTAQISDAYYLKVILT